MAKKKPTADKYQEKLTRYHLMIEQAVEDTFTRYSRKINERLYLYYHPASGKQWGSLHVHPALDDSVMTNNEVRYVTTEPIPRNMTREALYDWMKTRLRHLPLYGA